MEMTIEAKGLNLEKAAQYIGVSKPTLMKLLPKLPHQRVGKRYVISKAGLDKWLEGQTQSQSKAKTT
jgi:excisionase family DNA binding protein